MVTRTLAFTLVIFLCAKAATFYWARCALVIRSFSGTCNANNNCCVLKLNSTIVLTNCGENCNGIANNGSVACGYHCIISVTSLVEATVDVNLVAFSILDVEVTVLSALNFGNSTGDEVLFFCVSVVLLSCANGVSINDSCRSCECKDPTVLDLSGTVVLTNYTENYNVVACNGL